MHKTFASGLLGLTLLGAGPALADLSGNAGLSSNGFFHGTTVTNDGGFMFAGLNYQHKNGVYAFGKTNNVDDNGEMAMEVDYGGGIKRKLGEMGVDLGVISYNFPNTTRDTVNELYVGSSYKALSAAFATNEGGNYLQLNAQHRFPQRVTVTLHAGNTYPKDGTDFMDTGLHIHKSFKQLSVHADVVHSAADQLGGTKYAIGLSQPLRF